VSSSSDSAIVLTKFYTEQVRDTPTAVLLAEARRVLAQTGNVPMGRAALPTGRKNVYDALVRSVSYPQPAGAATPAQKEGLAWATVGNAGQSPSPVPLPPPIPVLVPMSAVPPRSGRPPERTVTPAPILVPPSPAPAPPPPPTIPAPRPAAAAAARAGSPAARDHSLLGVLHSTRRTRNEVQ
jgi:hypothetical protein